MKEEKYYVINNFYYIATNVDIVQLQISLLRYYDIDINSIKEITENEYFNWLKEHKNRKCKNLFFD